MYHFAQSSVSYIVVDCMLVIPPYLGLQDMYSDNPIRRKLRNPQPGPGLYPGSAGDRPHPCEHTDLLEDENGEAVENKIDFDETADVNAPNTCVFTFNREDHTLSNLISQRLLKYDHVEFAAYKVAGPHEPRFDLRVTTDGTMTPKQAVIKCCKEVVIDLDAMKESFTTEWLNFRIARESMPKKE